MARRFGRFEREDRHEIQIFGEPVNDVKHAAQTRATLENKGHGADRIIRHMHAAGRTSRTQHLGDTEVVLHISCREPLRPCGVLD